MTSTYLELKQDNEALRALLKEAVAHGLHDEACQSGPFITEPDVTLYCNCWLRFARVAVAPPVVVAAPKDLSVLLGVQCDTCSHTQNSHVNQKGLCTGESCPCFKFVPPRAEVSP
jgi:hypothetical protein